VIVIYYVGWQISNKRSQQREQERVANVRQMEASGMSGGRNEKEKGEAENRERV
jgi:hypothetical protein